MTGHFTIDGTQQLSVLLFICYDSFYDLPVFGRSHFHKTFVEHYVVLFPFYRLFNQM